MFMKHFTTFATGVILMSATAAAQEDSARYRSEVSVQAQASFVKQTTRSGVQQGATESSGVIATYRYHFDRHNGIEANYAWAPSSQKYNGFGVENNSHEISAAYVFRFPLTHCSPFVLAGAGALIFDPANVGGANTQTRAAFVYAAGADFNLSPRVFVRAKYRGFVYNSPSHDLAAVNGVGQVTHRAEPSIGFDWRS